MRIHVDKVASVNRNLRLEQVVTLTKDIKAEAGAVIAGRVLNDKSAYNRLEDVYGRMNVLHSGDVIIGALGHRNALHGYEGVLPESVKPGQSLQILNLGGIIGDCVSHNPDVGPPFEVEVLGQVLVYPDFQSRKGRPANINMTAKHGEVKLPRCPVVFVAGTCMNAGKTAAACTLIKHFRQAGLKVAGVKLTGISLLRDILSMRDYGAAAVMDFTDAGIVCTRPETAAQVAKKVLSQVSNTGPDVIVAETGDGVMGEYGVQAILGDPDLQKRGRAFVFCANDPVGVAGGVNYLQDAFQITVDVVTGPATDNHVGVRFVENEIGVPACNARNNPEKLADIVMQTMSGKFARPA
ncbi:MAG: hypothetical protein MJA83_14830 [Gammaproteobacteria bacterium]|nr:hypothetical protein [Gammaproteobacteria bacterium]